MATLGTVLKAFVSGQLSANGLRLLLYLALQGEESVRIDCRAIGRDLGVGHDLIRLATSEVQKLGYIRVSLESPGGRGGRPCTVVRLENWADLKSVLERPVLEQFIPETRQTPSTADLQDTNMAENSRKIALERPVLEQFVGNQGFIQPLPEQFIPETRQTPSTANPQDILAALKAAESDVYEGTQAWSCEEYPESLDLHVEGTSAKLSRKTNADELAPGEIYMPIEFRDDED